MSIYSVVWEKLGCMIEVRLDYNVICQRYGISSACEKYHPMFGAVKRIGDSVDFKTDPLEFLMSLRDVLCMKNKERKYPIPIQFISLSRKTVKDVGWAPRYHDEIPVIVEKAIISDFADINTYLEFLLHSIIDSETYCIGIPLNKESFVSKTIVMEVATVTILASYESINSVVSDDNRGVHYHYCNSPQEAFDHAMKHLTKNGAIYTDRNITLYCGKIISSSTLRGKSILDFYSGTNNIIVEEICASEIITDYRSIIVNYVNDQRLVTFFKNNNIINLLDMCLATASSPDLETATVTKIDEELKQILDK